MSIISVLNIVNNYRYLLKLKTDLENFCNTEDFNIFTNNSKFFEETYNELISQIRGELYEWRK